MEKLDLFLEQHNVVADCRVISNGDFFQQIVDPVCELTDAVSDTSELFMRSVQLMLEAIPLVERQI